MAGRKTTPKYKQPLPGGLTKAQKIAELQKRMKTATRYTKTAKNPSHTRNPEVRLSDWIRLNKLNLVKWTQSKHQKNQVVAEQLSRIIFAVESGEMVIDSYHHPTFRAAFDRLKKAENLRKEVSLTPQQVKIIGSYFRLV
ncbi:MAG: hypothetical protein HON47_03245 [Candidatus Diapherotrites archaeon]|jgi:hypothetical protein|uniref:Uncharacterized protein n=1 Tax=Candidatus Iainarchaeum sp. TaxID=3101447 RepID=A0A8T5GF82_9ARCH|nr:hypothetical protein [Candidatus Diapherotrites archaeon]MBT7241308.1 hypothetical protein [Candidatus Diapherotrites archaeon]